LKISAFAVAKPGIKSYEADGKQRFGMQSVKLIDSEFLNQTVFNHVTAAGETFFSPLEDGN